MAVQATESAGRARTAPILIPMGPHAGRPPIQLNRPVFVIGSRRNARIHLMSSTVSKAHALLVQTRHATYLRDLASRTHTFVNGQPIREVILTDGAAITIGRFTFEYRGPRHKGIHEPTPVPATLHVTGAELPIPIEDRVILIGRRKTCDVPLQEETVSTAHAVIFQWEGKRFIRDLGSRTGTYVNGTAVHESELQAGDVIHIGDTNIEYVPSTVSHIAHSVEVVEGASAAAIADAPEAEELDSSLLEPLTDEELAAQELIEPEPVPELQPTTGQFAQEPPPVAPEIEPEIEPLPQAFEPELEPEPEPEAIEAAPEIEPEIISPTPAESIDVFQPEPEPEPELPPLEVESEFVPIEHAPEPEAKFEPQAPPPVEPEPILLEPMDLEPEAELTPNDTASIPFALEQAEHVEQIEQMPAAPPEPFAPAASIEIEPELPPLSVEAEAPAENLSAPPEPVETVAEAREAEPIAEIPAPQAPVELPHELPSRGWHAGPIDAAEDLSQRPDVIRFPHEETSETYEPAGATAAFESAPPSFEPAAIEARAEAEEPTEQPVEIDLSSVKFDEDQSAAIAEPAEPHAVAHDMSVAPMLDLPPLDIEVEPRPFASELAAPLIAADAIAPPAEAPPKKRRRRRRETFPQAPVERETAAPYVSAEIPAPSAPPAPPEAPEPEESPEPPEPPPSEPLEVVEPTEPTPESAQSLEQAEAIAAPSQELSSPEIPVEQVASLTDSTFDRDVQEFAGETTGPLVEAAPSPAAEAPEPAPIAESVQESAPAPIDEEAPIPVSPERGAQILAEVFKNWRASEDTYLGGTPFTLPPIAPKAEEEIKPVEPPAPVEPPPVPAQPREPQPALNLNETEELPPPLKLDDIEPLDLTAADEVAAIEPPPLPAEDDKLPLPDALLDELGLEKLLAEQRPVLEEEAPALAPAEPAAPEQPAAPEPPLDDAAVAELLAELEPPPTEPETRPSAIEEAPTEPVVPEPPAVAEEPEPVAEAPGPVSETPPPVEKVEPPAAAPAAQPPSPPPPAAPIPTPQIMPPPPLRRPRKRREHRPTVIRNAFGQDPNAPRPESEVGVPPFAGADATVESASAKIEGLVGGTMREMDVFSQASPPEVGDVFADTSPGAIAEPAMTPMDLVEPERAEAGLSGAGAAPPPIPPPPSGPSGPSDLSGIEPEPEEIGASPGEMRRRRPGDAVGPRRPQVTYGAPDAVNVAEQRRRSKLRRVPVLIAVMLLLIGAAVAASFYFVPVRTQVEATVRFTNFDAFTQSEQRKFQAEQLRLLSEEMTRRNAQRILAGRHQDVAAGFLGDPNLYAQVANVERVAWPPSRGSTQSMVVRYDGTDANGDQYRMEALALALYDSYVNSLSYKEGRDVLDKVVQLRAQIDSAKRRRDDLYKEIDHQREIGDARPTPAQINSIQSERDQLERTYNQLIVQRKGAQADLDRMKNEPAGRGPATQPVDLAASDAQLAQMQKDADALKTKISGSRADRVAAADGARKVLDAAVQQLQKEIDAAKPLITGENNELSGYISAAQNLQSAIQQLTDEYVQRQPQQYAILADIRARRDQKIQARRSELWANDVQLRQLSDQKEVTTRKLNTALAAGQDKDASDLQNDLKLIDNSIKARQDVLANDPLYADEINQLQASYEKQEKAIGEDRQSTNERLASLAKTFTQMQPAVERLPDNQKQVATAVQKRLSDLSQARNAYANAFDAATAGDDDTSVRQASGDLQTILASIEARKKQLLISGVAAAQKQQEQSRQAAISAKEAEVARLIKAEGDAQAAFMNKNNELLKAQAQVTEARSSGEKMLQMQRELDTLDRQLEQNNVALSYKERDAKRIVEAVQPNPDVDVVRGQPIDQRWMYAAGSSGAVLLIFSCWILLTLLSAAREANYPYASFARATDQGPVPADENRKPLNGSQEEESEPAVV